MKRIIITILLLSLSSLIYGEWSTDPSENFHVAGTDCNQEYTHITVGSDGNYYISRYQDEPQPQWYSMRMERLDLNGNKLWGEKGILVSDHPFDSWFSNHALITDHNNNAVLAFSDMRAGTGFRNVNAYLIAPDSSFLWGPDGVQLSNSLHDEFSPRAIVTDAGNYVFSWIRDYGYDDSLKASVVMHKLLPNGQEAWPGEIELFGSDTTFTKTYLVPSDGDNFINVWMRIYQTGSGLGREYHSFIYAQKFDTNGDPVWDSITTVCDLDSLAPAVAFYQVPEVISDGNNGVFVSWYDSRIDAVTMQTYVQHILSDGTVDWQENGVLAADYNDHYQVDPSLCYYEALQKLYVIWNDYYYDGVNLSYRYGISAQLLSNSGEMLWSDSGVVLQPYSLLASNGYSLPQAHITPEGDAVVVYAKDSLTVVNKADTIYSMFVKATRVDQDGDFVWNDEQVWLSSVASWKLSFFSSDYMNDQVVTIWTDNRGGTDLTYPGDLYAQNVRGNGSLGPAISIDPPHNEEEMNIGIYPNPVSGDININYYTKKTGKTEFSLYNLKGQLLAHKVQENELTGSYKFNLAIENIKPGIYFLKVENKIHYELRKVVILN